MFYDRFDKHHDVPADPEAGKIAIIVLVVWGIIASIAIIETFTNWLD